MIPLSLIFHSGDFDRIHYGLVTATTAAAMDKQVRIFVTMAACRAFMSHGWKQLTLSSGVAGMNKTTPVALNDHFRDTHIVTFEELIEIANTLSIRFIFCEMGMRAMGLTRDALDPSIAFESGGMVGFLREAEQGTLLLI